MILIMTMMMIKKVIALRIRMSRVSMIYVEKRE